MKDQSKIISSKMILSGTIPCMQAPSMNEDL